MTKIKKILRNYFDSIFSKSYFCLYRNSINFLKNRKVYLSYDKNKYSLKDLNNNKINLIYSPSKIRITRFEQGIEKKIRNLSKKYFLDLVEFQKDDLMIDCGANLGELGLFLQLKYKNQLNYIAFEPSYSDYECLKLNLYNLRFNSYQFALSNKNEKDTFYLSIDSADSSLIKPNRYTEKIMVEKKRLDEFFIDTNYIKYLKIEAEGHEPEVLYGCEKILNKVEYICVDVSPERNNESTLKDVTNYLFSRKFEIINFSSYYYTLLFKRI